MRTVQSSVCMTERGPARGSGKGETRLLDSLAAVPQVSDIACHVAQCTPAIRTSGKALAAKLGLGRNKAGASQYLSSSGKCPVGPIGLSGSGGV